MLSILLDDYQKSEHYEHHFNFNVLPNRFRVMLLICIYPTRSDLIQIICTQWHGIQYFYLILTICEQLDGYSNYSYLWIIVYTYSVIKIPARAGGNTGNIFNQSLTDFIQTFLPPRLCNMLNPAKVKVGNSPV